MSDCRTPITVGNRKDTVVESCCAPDPESAFESNQCHACGNKGKKVDSITPKAMLNISLLALRDVPYFFCPTADCEVVYFSGDGEQSFTKVQVRELIFQKEPQNDDVLVCYCFRHSPATIRAELLNTGQSTVIAEINAGIKAGQCACEVRNPQGSCCLGNVSQVVKHIKHVQTGCSSEMIR
jgi:hypothetical protein